MSEPCSTGCGRPSPGAFICRDCTRDLEQAIAELPARIRDLELAATRQARVGNPPAPLRLDEQDVMAEAEHRAIPAHLRSPHGPTALVATSLPFAPATAVLHALAVNAVTTWARHLCESRGMGVVIPDPTPGPVCEQCRHGSCAAVRVARLLGAQAQATRLCAWLVAHIDAIRQDEAAAEIHRKVLALSTQIDASIDRHDVAEFVGRCDALDVRVDGQPALGPACTSLACPHDSCESIRGDAALALRTSTCGADLHIAPGDVEVQCPTCSMVYEVAERRTRYADRLADVLGTVRQVAGVLRAVQLDMDGEQVALGVTVDRIDGWLKRGRIVHHGQDANGHRLVRVGEVREYAEAWERRRAARRKVTVASERMSA